MLYTVMFALGVIVAGFIALVIAGIIFIYKLYGLVQRFMDRLPEDVKGILEKELAKNREDVD